MKINEKDAILTPKVLLVPYSTHHVPTYHLWMQDKDLQQLTASEPLTLEEEFAMQTSWRHDADKLTFIVCTAPQETSKAITPGEQDAPADMLGDVNLFLYPSDSDADDAAPCAVVGEVEIMIASAAQRGRGYARATLEAFLWYVGRNLGGILAEYGGGEGNMGMGLEYLRVKIDKDNERSLRLFEGAGFVRVGEKANYFGEIELRLPVTEGRIKGMERLQGVVTLRYGA